MSKAAHRLLEETPLSRWQSAKSLLRSWLDATVCVCSEPMNTAVNGRDLLSQLGDLIPSHLMKSRLGLGYIMSRKLNGKLLVLEKTCNVNHSQMEARRIRNCKPPLFALARVVFSSSVGGCGFYGQHGTIHASLSEKHLGSNANDLMRSNRKQNEVIVSFSMPKNWRFGSFLQVLYRAPPMWGCNTNFSLFIEVRQ